MEIGHIHILAEDVKAKYDELDAKGVAFKVPYTVVDPITIFILTDPDGNDVEVYHAKV